jgi:hypothetical protein
MKWERYAKVTLLALESVTPVEGRKRVMHPLQLLKEHKPELGVNQHVLCQWLYCIGWS